MAAKTKANSPSTRSSKERDKVVLYLLIDGQQQQALRVLSFVRQTPMADIVREAIDQYLASKGPSAEDVERVVKQIRKAVRLS